MKILIISQYYYPEQFQINEIAVELVNHGHEVTVLTGLPNYPRGKIYKEYRFFNKRYEKIAGVKVIRCFEIGRRRGIFYLLLNYISFAISSSLKVLFIRDIFDIVYCYQLSPVIMAFPAVIYKKLHNKKLLLYCLDIWPESAKVYVKNINGLFYNIITKISKSLYEKCDVILVSSPEFIGYFSDHLGINQLKLGYLPQHANNDYLKLNSTVYQNKIINFVFAGNIGHVQAVENIIYAAVELRELENIKIHIVGDGSCKASLESIVKKEHIEDKVLFYGNLLRAEMNNIFTLADALLITLRGDSQISNTVPGKLPVYMSTGKPILGAVNGTARDIIIKSGCGACVSADDYIGLSLLMKDFIYNKYKYEGCCQRAREYFLNHYTLDLFLKNLEESMCKMLM